MEGSVFVGLGNSFAPIVEGEQVTVQLGAQGLWMFVGAARVRDMEVGSDEQRAAVQFDAIANGRTVSLDVGCRAREFAVVGSDLEMVTPFFVALNPDFTPELDGANVTLVVNVRDYAGRSATDQRSIIARLP